MTQASRGRARWTAAAQRMAVVLMVGVLTPMPRSAVAQLVSPGKLAQAHVDLEGLANCTRCHAVGEQVDPARCLDCHKALAARIEAGTGYHRDKGRDCVRCHADHLGRDYRMVRWDRDAFDHAEAGYPLQGRHRQVRCEQCHTDTTGTFLGLATACASCHRDAHRGQLGTDCAACHGLDGWRPAPGFDHQKARYPLAGRHATTDCQLCHERAADPPDSGFVRYRDLAFAACRDCHADSHQGQLAGDCAGCHTEAGWQPAPGFDHERARFRLRGRHGQVACDRCHKLQTAAAGAEGIRRFRPVAFGQCRDCHADYHQGQLAADCAACHSDAGWKPTAGFDHGRARFALTGRHAAVACDACHRPEAGADGALRRYRPVAFGQCRDCHADFHEGQLAADCAACHGDAGWKPTAGFDHGRARFALTGRHAAVACDACHRVEAGADGARRRYRPVAFGQCRDCHADFHEGQLAADCAGCHVDAGWQPATLFDHDRARLRLDGAHVKLACATCHPTYVGADGAPRQRYRPLPTDCAGCHGPGP